MNELASQRQIFTRLFMFLMLAAFTTPSFSSRPPELTMSVDDLIQESDGGNGYASVVLGIGYARGGQMRMADGYKYPMPKNKEKAFYYWRRAIEQGDDNGIQYMLVYSIYGPARFTLEYGTPWVPDWDGACKIAEKYPVKSYMSLSSSAKDIAGQCYLTLDANKGLSILISSAVANKSVFAAKLLADIYSSGQYGVAADPEKSGKWLATAQDNYRDKQAWHECLDYLQKQENYSSEAMRRDCGNLQRYFLD